MKKFLKAIDMKDILFSCGLLLLFVGLYQYKPWTAPTATGIVMILTGLFGNE